jgi:hypothetical protein
VELLARSSNHFNGCPLQPIVHAWVAPVEGTASTITLTTISNSNPKVST